MAHEPALLQSLAFLAAAALFVPIFKRIGLGSIVGYLAAGLALGPWGVGLVTELEGVRRLSEIGIVLLMFLVGLELNAERLWSMRRAIFGLGTLQVALTIALVALAVRLLDQTWTVAIVLGMAAAMSSTAISLQILGERAMVALPSGRSAFAVALFQDIAVIPLLLGLSLLLPRGAIGQAAFSWQPIATGAVLIAAMIAFGRIALRPLMKWIASVGMREIFIAFALLLVVSSAVLTELIGLSPAMGAFIAGLLLADSQYRLELEVDLDPFRGLLLGLFFIAVGMSIDVALILARPGLIIGLAFGVVALKVLVLRTLARFFGLHKQEAWAFALAVSQVGEFAFVLLGQAGTFGLLDDETGRIANAVVAVTMLTTPLLFLWYDKRLLPYYGRSGVGPFDRIEERNRVIVAGMGRFGQIVVRLLRARRIEVTAIDHDTEQIEAANRFGWRTYYGDARRPDVLAGAGIEEAHLCILAFDDPDGVVATARHIRDNFPRVRLLARSRSRIEAQELTRLGVPTIRELIGSAVEAAELALVEMGEDPAVAADIAERFRRHDEDLVRRMSQVTDREQRLKIYSQGRADFMRVLEAELAEEKAADPRRQDVTEGVAS
ncbi:MAG: monovalent cation:proton antiporter-2 (CPA2) family protein [Burkholderiaceae bacterium]